MLAPTFVDVCRPALPNLAVMDQGAAQSAALSVSVTADRLVAARSWLLGLPRCPSCCGPRLPRPRPPPV